SQPQCAVGCLGERFNRGQGNIRFTKTGETDTVISEQPGCRTHPKKAGTILQKSVNFRLFQAITMTVIPKLVTLSRQRQGNQQQNKPQQTCESNVPFAIA